MPKGKYTYRIKTQKEFLKEFGTDWRSKLRYVWISPSMDGLFGKKITHKEYYDIHNDIRGIGPWSISLDMIKTTSDD